MPEFKVKCWYFGESKNKFFKDKEKRIYHKFSVPNAGDLPNKIFRSLSRDKFNKRDCWLWISKELIKKLDINWESDKTYCFLMKLGEHKTAAFNIKNELLNSEKVNNMVLKDKSYWENTVKKIGFWGSEDYFYELKKDRQNPTKNQNNNPTQSENKTDWGKIAIFCLPIVMFALFSFLLIKWVSKKKE